ncbi:hypothetical protein D3C76_1846370 [compost metagenome]
MGTAVGSGVIIGSGVNVGSGVVEIFSNIPSSCIVRFTVLFVDPLLAEIIILYLLNAVSLLKVYSFSSPSFQVVTLF